MADELINTLANRSEFDAMTSLRPEEPYFLLVGRDRLAPALVQKWADRNRERALAEFEEGKIDAAKRDRELRKSTQAEAISWAMQSFKAGDMAKHLTGEPTAKTYTGFKLDEDTKRRDALQSARFAAIAAISNAVAQLANLHPLLVEDSALDRDPISAVANAEIGELLFREMHDLKGIADMLNPPRPVIK